MDSAWLEGLRHCGLRLDGEGRWWHEGELVVHSRLVQALHRWLDRLEDGRFIVRTDERLYAYVEVDDAPYIVRRVKLEDARNGDHRLMLELSDDSSEELDYATLTEGASSALYCQVKGRFDARFGRSAQQTLAPLLREVSGGFALRAGGNLWPIGVRGEHA